MARIDATAALVKGRELAHWLRGVAAKCRLPATQKEILNLARRYESRASHLGRRGAARLWASRTNGHFGRWSDWQLFLVLLPALKR